jgi:CRP/FNR family transcriptional regulator, cyclic AMP receptor protein
MDLFDYSGTAQSQKPFQEISFLADLSADDWSRILKLVETRLFRAGDSLIRAGDKDDSFYILTSGEVEVTLGAKVLTTIPEGSVFGEISFFDGAPRSASIRAKSHGSAVRVTRQNFDHLAAWEPAIARQILFDLGRVLAARLRWTTSLASA